MKIDNGGYAFPLVVGTPDTPWGMQNDGMTLRDYFAAAALQGMIAGGQGLAISVAQFASQSYLLADAMIAAGKQTPPEAKQGFQEITETGVVNHE